MPLRRDMAPAARSALATLSRSPLPTVPTTFGENFDASLNSFIANEQVISRGRLLTDFYDTYLGTIEAQTGKRLPNPFVSAHEYMTKEDVQAALRAGDPTHLGMPIEEAERRALKRVRELRQQHPESTFEELTPEDIRERIGAFRRGEREEAAETARRGDAAGAAGAFAGTMVGAATDPLVAASMLLGAGAGATVLRTALVEAGVGGVSEAAVQTIVQSQREEFGEDADFEEALQNILAASLGGFVLGGALRAAEKGVRSVAGLARNRADARVAERILVDEARKNAANPLGDSPAARAEHTSRVEAEDARVRGQSEERVSEEPRARPKPKPKVRPKPKREPVTELDDSPTAVRDRELEDAVIKAGEEIQLEADTTPSFEPGESPDFRGAEADVFVREEDVVRVTHGSDTPERPVSNAVLQALHTEVLPDGRRVEFLPFIDDIQNLKSFSTEESRDLVERLSHDGLVVTDSVGKNFGRVDGQLKVVDPGAVSRLDTLEALAPTDKRIAGKLEEAQAVARSLGVDINQARGRQVQVPTAVNRTERNVPRTEPVAREQHLPDDSTQRDLSNLESVDAVRSLEEIVEEDPDAVIFLGEGNEIQTMRVQDVLDDIRGDEEALASINRCIGGPETPT